MFILPFVKPFPNRNSSFQSSEVIQLNEHKSLSKPHLIAKWLKDEEGNLYCRWSLE